MHDEFVTPSINKDYISLSYLTRVTQMLLMPTPGTDKARKCPAVVRACWAPLELTDTLPRFMFMEDSDHSPFLGNEVREENRNHGLA